MKSDSKIRHEIVSLISGSEEGSVILTPGLLIGLKVLTGIIPIGRLVLTTEEYYRPDHFAGLEVHTVQPDAVVETVKRVKPDAILMSAVTWSGRKLPVGDIFKHIRAVMKTDSPVLIADCSHVGAAGFPPWRTLHADMVMGDPVHWLLPNLCTINVGFLWFASAALFEKVRPAFSSFYLAVEGTDGYFQSRWLDPSDLTVLSKWFTRHRINRASLSRMHMQNLKLACCLTAEIGLENPPDTSIVWIPNGTSVKSKLLSSLKRCDLVWEVSGIGLRVQCRADILRTSQRRSRSKGKP